MYEELLIFPLLCELFPVLPSCRIPIRSPMNSLHAFLHTLFAYTSRPYTLIVAVRTECYTREVMDVQCKNEARSCNHCCSGKAMSITQSECICSLRYPARNAHAPWSSVTCPALQYYSTFSYKRHDV
jgi:hypothetical protein